VARAKTGHVVQEADQDYQDRREIQAEVVHLEDRVQRVRVVCQDLMVCLECLEERVTEVCRPIHCCVAAFLLY